MQFSERNLHYLTIGYLIYTNEKLMQEMRNIKWIICEVIEWEIVILMRSYHMAI